MSLFHNPRDIRWPGGRKRQRSNDQSLTKETYICDLCSEAYDDETDLHHHRKLKHKSEMAKMMLDQMVCKTCITKYASNEQLIKHIKKDHLLSSADAEHVAREIFVCDQCHLIYFNKQMLTVHILYTHDKANRNDETTRCPKCSRTIKIKNAWFHFQRHLAHTIGCCPICIKECNNLKELQHHLQEHSCHFRCNICQYEAGNKSYFDSHMKRHKSTQVNDGSDTEEIVKRCFIPQVSTKRNSYMTGLRGLRLFELQICVLCRAICTEESRADHVNRFHVAHPVPMAMKQYACSCGETFFNNILLRHHIFKMKDGGHRSVDSVSEQPSEQMEVPGNSSVTLENDSNVILTLIVDPPLPSLSSMVQLQ